jgi:hypothetical protein
LRLPLVVVPLFAYISEMLVIPALNGAIERRGFWEHAAIVVTVTATIAGLLFLPAPRFGPSTQRPPP